MTALILKSTVASFPNFAEMVDQHARELTEHAEHMEKVKASQQAMTEMNAHVETERQLTARAHEQTKQRDGAGAAETTRQLAHVRNKKMALHPAATSHQSYPPPQAHPMIDQAIARAYDADGKQTFQADYQLVDAIPIAAGDVAALKTRKDELRSAVHLLENDAKSTVIPPGRMRAHNIRVQDIEKADAARADQIIKNNGGKVADDLAEKVHAGRPVADSNFMADHQTFRDAFDKINRHSAVLESAIEDLTEADIHLWKPQPFPGR